MCRESPMGYLLLKFVHIAAAVLFLGNITLGVFWVRHARRYHSPARLAEAMDGVIRSDRLFTTPFVFVLIGAGSWMAITAQLPFLGTPWLLAGIVLFGLSGVLFGALAPLQRKIRDYAAQPQADWSECLRLLRRWEWIGGASLVCAWAALAAMVLKLPR